jgi:hypothetical protein
MMSSGVAYGPDLMQAMRHHVEFTATKFRKGLPRLDRRKEPRVAHSLA